VADVLRTAPKDVRAAVVSVEPGTGAVKASYGGRAYGDRQALDGVWQERRQPGSTFKPITLATALSQGIGLRSTYDGSDDKKVDGYPDGLSNFGDHSYGRLDLLQATAKSVNTIYVPLGIEAGLGRVVATAHRLGIPKKTKLEAVPSITLGTQFVRPVDMADVFATFAAGGEHAEPFVVAKVTRGRKVLYAHKKKTDRAVDEGVAADVTYALQGVLKPGGTAAAAALDGRPAAGKTGTTTDNTAAWFVGFTPQLSTAVALFGPKPADRLKMDGVREVTGGSYPARVWHSYMTSALAGLPVEAFPPPAFVGAARNAAPSPTPSGPPAKKPGPAGKQPGGTGRPTKGKGHTR
jgi:membrane peptidoglycan carboxypeptidase